MAGLAFGLSPLFTYCSLVYFISLVTISETYQMSLLSDQSLEFAREHIEKYYDSDFFPKLEEYEALWHSWDEVKKELTSTNVKSMSFNSPTTSTSTKPKGGFRVVQQLDAIETLIYISLAYTVAEAIENKRVPKESKVACSYRIEIKNGSFFSNGNGFQEYIDKSQGLASEFDYVLYTDITDFYNQIYLHRLCNAISYADHTLEKVADDVEYFLSTLNGKTSQGIPVGPAASVLMAEAILLDIDEYLIDQNIKHTRYVDDYRIFSNTKEKLTSVLESLTLYLYKSHRLTIATDKTGIMGSKEYINKVMFNSYEVEKQEIIRKIEVFNPYSEQFEEMDNPFLDENHSFEEQIDLVSQRILDNEHLDLGIARYFIRKSKKHKIEKSAQVIFDNFNLFLPVVNDVFLYLDKVSDTNFIDKWKNEIIGLSTSSFMQRNLVKTWFEWYISRNIEILKIPQIEVFVFASTSINCQSKAAIKLNKLSWIRSKKDEIQNFNNKEKLAVIRAAQILPKDERKHWLSFIQKNSSSSIEKWVAKWVKDI